MTPEVGIRGWDVIEPVKDVGSWSKDRPGGESLPKAARRREIDVIVVWRLDRWGRSLADLMRRLGEWTDPGVGLVWRTEALDWTTPAGRAMAGMLAILAEFEREILRDRVKAGIARARQKGRPHGRQKGRPHGRQKGRPHGRPRTAWLKAEEVIRLRAGGMSRWEMARRLGIGRTSVRRILDVG